MPDDDFFGYDPAQLDEILQGREAEDRKQTEARDNFVFQRSQILGDTSPHSPDDTAFDQRVSAEKGIPQEAVAVDRPRYRQEQERSKVETIRETAPSFAEWLAKEENYAIARDDIDTLAAFSQSRVFGVRQAGVKGLLESRDRTFMDGVGEFFYHAPGQAAVSFEKTYQQLPQNLMAGNSAEAIQELDKQIGKYRTQMAILSRSARERGDYIDADIEDDTWFVKKAKELGIYAWNNSARSPATFEARAAQADISDPRVMRSLNERRRKIVELELLKAHHVREEQRRLGIVEQVRKEYLKKAPSEQVESDTVAGLLRGVDSLVANAPGFMAGAVTRSPTVGAAFISGQVGNDSYGSARLEGLSHENAVQYAVNDVVAEFIGEKIGLSRLFGAKNAKKSIARRLLEYQAVEQIQEQPTTFLQSINEWFYLNPEKTMDQFISEIGPNAYQTMLGTLVGSGPMSAVAAVTEDLMYKRIDREKTIMDSQDGEAVLKGQIQSAGKSKMLGRSPEKLKEAIEVQTEGSKSETTFIDLDGLGEALDQAGMPLDQVAEALGVTEQQYLDALATDGQLEVKTADLLSNPKFHENVATIQPHTTRDAEDLTPHQLEPFREATEQAIQEWDEVIKERAEKDLSFAESVAEVEERVFEQIKATGAYKGIEIKAQADLFAKLSNIAAERSGVDPVDFYENQFGAKIFGPSAEVVEDEGALPQARANGYEGDIVEDAKEWEAARAKGLDLSQEARIARAQAQGFNTNEVAYHATNFEFDEFVTDGGLASGFAMWGRGVYFATNQKDVRLIRRIYGRGVGNVLELYTRTQSTLDLTDNGHSLDYADIRSRLSQAGLDPDDMDVSLRDGKMRPVDLRYFLFRQAGEEADRKILKHLKKNTKPYFTVSDRHKTANVAKYLQAMGFDSVRFKQLMGDGGEEISVSVLLVFDPSNIRSIDAAFDPDKTDSAKLLDQSSNSPNSPAGQFNPATRQLFLRPGADMSTLPHEGAHVYLDMLERLAVGEDAHPFFVQQLEAIESWFSSIENTKQMKAIRARYDVREEGGMFVTYEGDKVRGRAATREQAQADIRWRERQEAFAETFEVFLEKAEAPSAEMFSVFSTFRRWLAQIYKSTVFRMSRQARADLNPEITQVFNRMLATDAAIDRAKAKSEIDFDRFAKAVLKRRKLDPEQQDEALAKMRVQFENMIDRVREEYIAEGMKKHLKRKKAVAKGIRNDIKGNVTREMDQQPARRATEWLGGARYKGDLPESEIAESEGALPQAVGDMAPLDQSAGEITPPPDFLPDAQMRKAVDTQQADIMSQAFRSAAECAGKSGVNAGAMVAGNLVGIGFGIPITAAIVMSTDEEGRERRRAEQARLFVEQHPELRDKTIEARNREAELAKESEIEQRRTQQLDAIRARYKDIDNMPTHSFFAMHSWAETMTGVDAGFLDDLIGAESAGDWGAEASTSTATGGAQFIKSTWVAMARKHGPTYGLDINPNVRSGDAREALLDLRKDRRWGAIFAAEYTKENVEQMEARWSRKVTHKEAYLAHFLGVDAAIEAYEADPDASAPELFPAAAEANQNVFYKSGDLSKPRTVGEMIKRQERKFSDDVVLHTSSFESPDEMPDDGRVSRGPMEALP